MHPSICRLTYCQKFRLSVSIYNLYALCLDHVCKFSHYQARHLNEILQSSSVPVVCNKACVCSQRHQLFILDAGYAVHGMLKARLSSTDFLLSFVRLTTPDLYKASEKRGAGQGYVHCSSEVTNQG